MLKKQYRFHGHGSVKYVYRKGKPARDNSLAVKAIAPTPRGYARIAVVVSKKVTKSAPKRNRIRRRIYEILRQNWDKVASGDIVITVFDESVANTKPDQLEASVLKLLSDVDCLK